MDKDRRNKDDFTCPICMYIMIQPVTMPCKHSLCMMCYKQCVEKASLACPVCRLRIAVWARKNSKAKTLVNNQMWEVIQRLFPLELKNQIDGNESECPEDDWDSPSRIETEIRRFKQLSEPGEIRQEYEAALAKLERQREEEARKEEEASAALIQALKEEEEEELAKLMKEREEHERIGRLTAEQLKQTEECDRARRAVRESSKESLSKVTNKQKRSASTCLKLDDFYARTRTKASSSAPPLSELATTLTGSQEAMGSQNKPQNDYSPYPYACLSPGSKNMVTPNVPDVPAQVALHRSRVTPHHSPARSHSTTSAERIDDVPLEGRESGSLSGLKDDVLQFVEIDNQDPGNDEVSSEDPLSGFLGRDKGHSFQPIDSTLRTPPKKLPSGEVVDPELIRTIPRNLGGFDFLSKKSSPSPSTSSCSSEIIPDQNQNHILESSKEKSLSDLIQTNLAQSAECNQNISSSSSEIKSSSIGEKCGQGDYYDKIMLTKKIVYGKCNAAKKQTVSSSYSCTLITESSSAFSSLLSQNNLKTCTVDLCDSSSSTVTAPTTSLSSSPSRCINNNVVKDSASKDGDDYATSDFFITDDTELLIPLETDIKPTPLSKYAERSSSRDDLQGSECIDLSKDEGLDTVLRTSVDLQYESVKSNGKRTGSETLIPISKRPSLSKNMRKKKLMSKGVNAAQSSMLRDWCKAGKRKEVSDVGEDFSDHSISFKKPLTQEEADHLFALQLQKSFSEQDKRNIQVDRFEGSSNEYSLRKKPRLC